jgi:hypothetical protein
MPANGFSWSSAAMPCSSATAWSVSIASTLVSAACEASEKIGESSCCEGATSLCSTVSGTPSAQRRSRTVVQHAARARVGARKVLVGALLAAERQRAEERAAGDAEVGAAVEERAVDEEELLLPADVGDDVADVGVAERVEEARRLAVERGVGAEQRRLVVERVAVPGDEDGGQIERLVDNKGRRGQMPRAEGGGGVRGAETAVWKRGAVGLGLKQIGEPDNWSIDCECFEFDL